MRSRQKEQMSGHSVNKSGYCGSSIADGQRWVREKIFDSAYKNDGDAKYRRYHLRDHPNPANEGQLKTGQR